MQHCLVDGSPAAAVRVAVEIRVSEAVARDTNIAGAQKMFNNKYTIIYIYIQIMLIC